MKLKVNSLVRCFSLRAKIDLCKRSRVRFPDVTSNPGGIGGWEGYSTDFYTGKLLLEVLPLTLLYTIFDRKEFSISIAKWYLLTCILLFSK